MGGMKAVLSQEDGTLLVGKRDFGGRHHDFEFQMSQSVNQAEEIDRLTREVQDLSPCLETNSFFRVRAGAFR